MSSGTSTVRKRDRFRDFFGKPAKTPSGANAKQHASANTTPGAATPPSALIPSSQSGNLAEEFYTATLTKLDAEEVSIVKEHVAPNITDAVQAAYAAATKQKRICEEKSWSGSDKAKKILLWLDRFKFAGDIVANADPIHVGLPWAGIRILLEAAVADDRQMTALMSGMDHALCIANRLQAYLAYFSRLSPSLTTDNLREALVALYAHLLRFLAQAIRIYSLSTSSRKVQAVWRSTELISFVDQSDKLGVRVDIEANNCDRESRVKASAEAARWQDDLRATLQKLDAIQLVSASLDALQVKIDLSKLPRVQEATYNSFAEEKLPLCLDGTRVEIISNITQWVKDPDGKFMFWLCGKAGTGKSTIARTIAQSCDKQKCLGASFFFKRSEKSRSNADHFFSTIAAQLADRLPHIQASIAAALDEDSFLCGRGLQEQFEKLLLQPLLSIDVAHLPQHNLVIVVDALDECDRDTDIRMFLRLLAQLQTRSALQLRIFMTSRPELPIQLGFRQLDGSLHQDIVLEEVEEQSIRRDIRAYFEAEFAKMKRDRLLLQPNDVLPTDWPSDDDVQTLVGLAVPLFIFASTVCRFISDSNPQKRLRVILEQRYRAASSHLAKTYLPILDQLLLEKDEEEREEMLSDFRQAVGPIIIAADPLSVASLANLLRIEQEDISNVLKRLHSVLQVPSSWHEPVRLLHQSFRDFLVDQRRKGTDGFWIDEMDTHKQLAEHCLRRVSEAGLLHRDLCNVRQPGFRRVDLAKHEIATRVSADVAYACSHWPWHLVKSGEQLHDNGQAHQFLQKHFLHWLEALSWIGRLSNAVTYIADLLSIAKGEDCREIAAFLAEAKRFVLRNRIVVDLAPLQVYHSALVFAPRKSIIRNVFQADHPTSWSLLPSTPLHWSAEIMKLEGHTTDVGAVAFSPDGQTVASVSAWSPFFSRLLRLWDAQSGEERLRIGVGSYGSILAFSENSQIVSLASTGNYHGTFDPRVQSWSVEAGEEVQYSGGSLADSTEVPEIVALSGNGEVVAITLHSWMVLLLETRTGRCIHCVEGHLSPISALTFSPADQIVTSGSTDGIVQLWDVKSGAQIHRIRGHKSRATMMAFAPDGQIIASASADGTVQLWNVLSGDRMYKLEGCQGYRIYTTVAFSNDGAVVVSASGQGTVRAWHVRTGKLIISVDKIEATDDPSTREVESVDDEHPPVLALSPIEQAGVVVMHDQTLQLWDLRTSGPPRRLEGHTGVVLAVTFSSCGQTIASASIDTTVRLWDARTGEQIQTLAGHNDRVTVLAFSPDNHIIASASHDKTARLWHARTGRLIQTLAEHEARVTAVAFSPNGHVLASASDDNRMRLWNAQTGEQMRAFDCEPHGRLFLMRFVHDGEIIVTHSQDARVEMRNTYTGEVLAAGLRDKSGYEQITADAFSPNCQTLAIGSDTGAIRLWDIDGSTLIRKFDGHDSAIIAIAFSSDGRTVAAGSSSHGVWLWNAQTGEQTLRLEPSREWLKKEEDRVIRTGYTSSIAFSPDGRFIAMSYRRGVQLWDLRTGEPTHKLTGDESILRRLSFSPDSQVLAVSVDETMQLWNVHSGEQMQECWGHAGEITGIAFSPNGQTTATASRDTTVRLWDTQHGDRGQRSDGHRHPVIAMAFSVDGHIVASASKDGAIRLWNARDGTTQLWNAQSGAEALQLEEDEDSLVSAVAFSPDGRTIALGSTHNIQIWDTYTRAQVQTLKMDSSDWQRTLTFLPRGDVVASLTMDRVQLLDVQTGSLIHNLGGMNWPTAVSLSPDGQAIAVVSSQYPHMYVDVWVVQTGERRQSLQLVSGTPERHLTSFSEDGTLLHTAYGTFIIEWTSTGTLSYPFKRTNGLELCDRWIRYRGQDLLYLPVDYRGGWVRIHGKTLVIGRYSRAVDFYQIK